MKYLSNLDLSRNQIQNALLHPLATAPATASQGQVYYNTVDNSLYQYTGAVWKKVGVVYSQGSSTGAVVTGLDTEGNVTVTNVTGLTLTGYTPVTDGVITAGMTFQQAMSALDTAIKGKQATITGGATSIVSSDLSASRALVSDANGKVAASDVTATELGYLDGVTSGVQSQFNDVNQRIDDISAIGRFLSYWNCATGMPVTEPTSLPYTYHTGDYFVVNAVASGGATNYKPDGTTYTGAASTVAETATVAPQDIYRFDGSVWSLSKNTGPDLSGYVATFSQSFTDSQKQQARTNIGAGTSSFSGSFNDLSNKPTTLNGYGITDANISSGVITLGSNTITPITSVNGETGSSVTLTQDDVGDGTTYKQFSQTEKNKLSGIDTNATANTITLNGSQTKTPSFYAPTTVGTSGQVLMSNGSGAPTWQNAPESVHKYTATNPSLTASGGVWTWTIAASTHDISNNSMFVSLYSVASGEQIIADVSVNSSTYAITITIVDSESAGTLADGTYRVVAVG